MSQAQQQQQPAQPQRPHYNAMADHDHPYGVGDQQQQQQHPSTSSRQPHHEQLPQYMYGPSSTQQPQISDTLLLGFGGDCDTSTTTGASHLDHALLESLFYNEMVLLDSSLTSSPNSHNNRNNSDFIAHHLAEATHQDPTTIVEKEILRDFGVGTPQRGTPMNPVDVVAWQQQAGPHSSTMVTYESQPYPSPPPGSSAPPLDHPSPTFHSTPQSQHFSSMVHPDHHATATAAAAAAAAMMHSPTPTVDPTVPSHHDVAPVATATPSSSSPPVPPPPLRTEPPAHMQSSHVVVPPGKARQLVDQFATLASRLGIDLPDTVLESLTAAAARNDPSLVQQHPTNAMATKSSAAYNQSSSFGKQNRASAVMMMHQDENSQNGNNSSDDSKHEELSVAPTVEELRKTAEEAIAAVTSYRKRSFEHQDSAGSDGGGDSIDAGHNNNNNMATTGAKSSSNKPAYSKRRKKPRLAECESKLAQLKAENEQLKRHLENVSNKAHKFDKEKEEAGKRITQLQHKNAGPQEMSAAVREFSDMYSDYGVNRQHELSFHLEQLQRLVNPTNFTKMGLWTLGQSTRDPKRNPIAGILVKELTITPQQGRKILDQSEKIQKLCDNLKETHALLVKLKALCEKKTQIFQDRMSKCTQILTSQQVVKLISWISEHTQLLESVCPGWGTEQAPLTSSKKTAAK